MNAEAWLRFAFLGLHPERARLLVESHGSVEAALAAILEGEEDVGAPVPDAAECRLRVRKARCRFEIVADGEWSGAFGGVVDPPGWLFAKGPLTDEPRVAIVGTRHCTEYGRRLAFQFGAACVEAGWTVVSGLARGIDAAAHRGALAGAGRTVAVLGCGPDVQYPRRHTELRHEIVGGGGSIVTEYPPGATPLGWRFPPRNRIIAGVSVAVVVIESAATGGSLSTAARAVAQGRTVLAVPGDVDREVSVGCNLLIRDGAVPVLGPDDLVTALSLLTGAPAGR